MYVNISADVFSEDTERNLGSSITGKADILNHTTVHTVYGRWELIWRIFAQREKDTLFLLKAGADVSAEA